MSFNFLRNTIFPEKLEFNKKIYNKIFLVHCVKELISHIGSYITLKDGFEFLSIRLFVTEY